MLGCCVFSLVFFLNPTVQSLFFKRKQRSNGHIHVYGCFSFVLLPGFVGLRKLYVFKRLRWLYFYSLLFKQQMFAKKSSFTFFENCGILGVLGTLWPSRGHHRLSREKLRRTVFFRALQAGFWDFTFFFAVFFLTLRIRVREHTRNCRIYT